MKKKESNKYYKLFYKFDDSDKLLIKIKVAKNKL
jgi:hypothetical protein